MTFQSYDLTPGLIADFAHDPHPTRLRGWGSAPLHLPAEGTHFGFVHEGAADLSCGSGEFRLASGMYFAACGEASIRGGTGLVVSRLGYNGFFQIGGPIESTGRLRYIDGCSDSLLISPVMLGDPCLNLLHLPPGTRQSRHTHPSLRAGLIIRGGGRCVTPEGSHDLDPGRVFVIGAEGRHSFHTDGADLLVLAYHPDSDCGPTHENHPMINRTILTVGAPFSGAEADCRIGAPA